MNINVLAIDIAKNVFQLCGVDAKGAIQVEKKLNRSKLFEKVQSYAPDTIVMEACGSANYWARHFMEAGFEVKLISPQFVKPFVKGNKNDKQDARGIAEASQRPNMPFVIPKTIEQQNQQSLLRLRENYIDMRTKSSNQIRGLLAEYGVIVSQGVHVLRAKLPSIFDREEDNGLPEIMKEWIERQYEFLLEINKQIEYYDAAIARLTSEDEVCKRIMGVDGIGQITAIAVLAQVGNAGAFKNGRHFAAYLGLVPKQYSSGNKERMLGISKRGDTHLRRLLVHGGRSVVRRADNREDRLGQWARKLKTTRGYNRASVAVANKNARIIFAMLKSGEAYDRDYHKAS